MYLREMMVPAVFIILLLGQCNARPWEIQQPAEMQQQYSGTFVPFLMRELDSWAATLLSDSKVHFIGAGAALAYLGYAGTVMLTSEQQLPPVRARFENASSELFDAMASELAYEALEHSQSAAAFRRAGARALQHGSTVLKRGLNAFTKAAGFVYSMLSSSQRALSTNCVAEKLCRVGQLTGTRWPILGVLLRSLDSPVLDEYAQALIDGTTIGDCAAIYPNCPD